jgi:hypothetical protein
MPWPLFQFLDPIHSRQDSLDGESARRTHTEKHRVNAHNTDIHTLSGVRAHDPFERAKTVHALEHEATVIGPAGTCSL